MPSGLIAQDSCEKEVEVRQASVMEQLRIKRDRAIKQVKEIEEAIALFEAHPEFEQCLTQLARVGIYR